MNKCDFQATKTSKQEKIATWEIVTLTFYLAGREENFSDDKNG